MGPSRSTASPIAPRSPADALELGIGLVPEDRKQQAIFAMLGILQNFSVATLDVYLDEIRKSGQYDKIWQAFAVLLPVQTVGVMGDGRTYEFVCALRAVTSVDGMTADFYPFDMGFLGKTATRIINEVRGINRVVYDVTSKPPGTIEWE